jgi:amyloid beta precursor protein binding protein 1
MAIKSDEENFEEAEAQAYRVWTASTIPSEIRDLFQSTKTKLDSLSASSPPFYRLLWALREFTQQGPQTLPLSSTLPDMKSDTKSYIHLQKLYKTRAEEEKAIFKDILKKAPGGDGGIEDAVIDAFVRNSHALRLFKGEPLGTLDRDVVRLGT